MNANAQLSNMGSVDGLRFMDTLATMFVEVGVRRIQHYDGTEYFVLCQTNKNGEEIPYTSVYVNAHLPDSLHRVYLAAVYLEAYLPNQARKVCEAM